jgi:CRISPR/Cas system-associated protein Csm6
MHPDASTLISVAFVALYTNNGDNVSLVSKVVKRSLIDERSVRNYRKDNGGEIFGNGQEILAEQWFSSRE